MWASTACSTLPQHQVFIQGLCGQTQPGWRRGRLQGHGAWEDCCPREMEPHLCGLRVRWEQSVLSVLSGFIFFIFSSLEHMVSTKFKIIVLFQENENKCRMQTPLGYRVLPLSSFLALWEYFRLRISQTTSLRVPLCLAVMTLPSSNCQSLWLWVTRYSWRVSLLLVLCCPILPPATSPDGVDCTVSR